MSKHNFEVKQNNLNSNVFNLARNFSTETVNSWGIAVEKSNRNPKCDCGKSCNKKTCGNTRDSYWVANNGTDTLIKYDSEGRIVTVVSVSSGGPTGIVINHSNNFGGYFILIATESGTVEGYNPNVGPNTVTVINNPGAIYKGIEIADNKLYVTNFFTGFVEAYDTNFNFINSFTGQGLLNVGYAPFNIAAHKNKLYVTFAKQDEDKEDDVAGIGHGYVNTFAFDGTFIARLINRGPLNSPWGLEFYGDFLYVGNFGDGRINVFNRKTGEFIGPLTDKNKNILANDGLWGIANISSGLAFAAGIDHEDNGLFGLLCFI